MSNIEHRLSYIEEQSEDVKHVRQRGQRAVHIDTISRSSSESGIHEDRDEDEERDFIDREMRKRQTEEDEWEERNIQRSINRVEIQRVPTRAKEPADVQLWDIMSHGKSALCAGTMLKLFEAYPNGYPKPNLNKKVYRKTNALTLGVPRTVRRSKLKSTQKHATYKDTDEKDFVFNTRQCQYCNCDQDGAKQREQKVFFTLDSRQESFKQNFPTRKPSVKISHHQKVECDCRLDPNQKKGPLLSITGHQVPLCGRDVLFM